MGKRISLLLITLVIACTAFPASYSATVNGIKYGFSSILTLYEGDQVNVSVQEITDEAVIKKVGQSRYVYIPPKVEFSVYNKNKYVKLEGIVSNISPVATTGTSAVAFDSIIISYTAKTIAPKLCEMYGIKKMDIYSTPDSFDFITPLLGVEGAILSMKAEDCVRLEKSEKFGSSLDQLSLIPNNISYYNTEYRCKSVIKNSERMLISYIHKNKAITDSLTAIFNGRPIKPERVSANELRFEISGEGYHLGDIEVKFSIGEKNWTLPFFIKGEIVDMSDFSYEIDEANKTATLIGYNDNLQSTSKLTLSGMIALPGENGYKTYRVDKIGENALAGAPVSTVILPKTVDTVAKNAFKGMTAVVFQQALKDYSVLPELGCNTLYLPADEIIAINGQDIQWQENTYYHISPTEIYFLGGDLSTYCKGVELRFPKDSDTSVRYGDESIAGIENNDYMRYIIRNSDCYPGSIIRVTISKDGNTQELPIMLDKKDTFICVSADKIMECKMAIGGSNSFPDELYGPDSSGIKYRCMLNDSYDELEFPRQEKKFDISTITLSRLVPDNYYEVIPYGVYNGHKIYWEDEKKSFKTNSLYFLCEVEKVYSRAVECKVKVIGDGSGEYSEIGAIGSGGGGAGEYVAADKNGFVTLVFPRPGAEVGIKTYAKYYGQYVTDSGQYLYLKLDAELITRETPTGFDAWIVNNDPYYEITDENVDWVLDGARYHNKDHFSIRGLKPESESNLYAYIGNRDAYGDVRSTFALSSRISTTALELEPLPCDMASNTCAILKAKTNVDVAETGMGFEWRRYDAPDEMPSYFTPCAVSADGYMAGKLHNLTPLTYYKFRPYYKASDGSIYYSKDAKWIAFITADAYVYFEPIVSTYDVEGLGDNTAVLRGYAVAGSDEIMQQGFEYWISDNHGGNKSAGKAPAATDITRVTATGQQMSATVSGLKSGTEYTYRTFVESKQGVTYGPEVSFKTTGLPDFSAIDDIIDDAVTGDDAEEILAIYNLQGVEMPVLQKGINIVTYKNGTVRKVVVK